MSLSVVLWFYDLLLKCIATEEFLRMNERQRVRSSSAHLDRWRKVKPTTARSEDVFIAELTTESKQNAAYRRDRGREVQCSLDLYFMIIEGGMAGTVARKKEQERQGGCVSFYECGIWRKLMLNISGVTQYLWRFCTFRVAVLKDQASLLVCPPRWLQTAHSRTWHQLVSLRGLSQGSSPPPEGTEALTCDLTPVVRAEGWQGRD